MTFPNAHLGVKRICRSQVLIMIAAVLMLLVSVMGAIMLAFSRSIAANILAAVMVVFSLGALVLTLIGLVLCFFGINRARSDEPSFFKALICVIVSLVLSVTVAFLSGAPTAESILQLLQCAVNLAATCFIITGIRRLSRHLGRGDIDGRGKAVMIILIAVNVLAIIASLLSEICSGKSTGSAMSILSSFLNLVQYVIYIVFLKRSEEMLQE